MQQKWKNLIASNQASSGVLFFFWQNLLQAYDSKRWTQKWVQSTKKEKKNIQPHPSALAVNKSPGFLTPLSNRWTYRKYT